MSDVRNPRPHEKKPLVRGVVLENRRYIGFTRTPVLHPDTKMVVDGLPTRLSTSYD